MKTQRGSRGIALPFHDLGTEDGGGWSAPRPGRFTPGKDPCQIYNLLLIFRMWFWRVIIFSKCVKRFINYPGILILCGILVKRYFLYYRTATLIVHGLTFLITRRCGTLFLLRLQVIFTELQVLISFIHFLCAVYRW